MNKSDVMVVGGGVIGASCAYHLAKKGVKVTLLEKSYFGAGASGCSAAMLECQTHAYRGPDFLSIAKPSLDLFPSLYQELLDLTGIDFDYEPSGILNLAMTEDEALFLKNCVHDQLRLGFRAEWLEPEDVEREFPQLNPEYYGGAYYLDDGQVNGEMFLDALLEGARKQGAELFDNAGSVTLGLTPTGVKAVSENQVFEADAYVVAAGAWSNAVFGYLYSPAIFPVRGQLIFYTSPSKGLKAPVFTKNHGYVVPKKRGYSLVGTTVEHVGFDDRTTDDALVELIKKGQFLVPALSRCNLRGSSSGLRPESKDDFPIIGPLPKYKNVFAASGHYRNGMLLAPITGKVISELVCGEAPSIDLSPFSPERFA